MSRRPFEPGELDVDHADDLEPVTSELERYARVADGDLPRGFSDRVMAAVSAEPAPRRGLLAVLLSPLGWGADRGVTRMVMLAGTMALAVLMVVAAGQLLNLLRNEQVGPSPAPSVIVVPSATPTLSPSSSPSETASPTPSATPTPVSSPTVSPSAEETGPAGTSSPSSSPDDDDDDDETPEPSDDDNSGPGGGGDDDSD